MLLNVLLGSLLCGVVGTGIGGLLGVFAGGRSKQAQCLLLSLSGGLLIGLVCFDLLPEAVEETSVWVAVAAAACAAILVYVLTGLLGKNPHKDHHEEDHEHGCVICEAVSYQEMESASVKSAGFVLFIALILHNLPEGMAIGTSGFGESGFWATVGIIALHNIPIGMTLAVMLSQGGMKPLKAVLLSVAVGFVTMVGATIGYFLGSVSPLIHALCLAFSAGSMLYITFSELLPQAVLQGKNKAVSLAVLLGVLVTLFL